MPFVHGKSTAVILGGTDVSSFLNSVDQTITRDVSESSTFGAQAKSYVKGQKDGTISLNGYWDGASGAIDSVMASALGNEVLGYGSELLTPSGDNVAAYTGLAQNISNAATPLPGFAASVEFIDNSLDRTAAKTVTTTAGTRYIIEVFIQMNDSSVPVFGGIAAGVDVRLNLEGTVVSTTTNVSLQLISGALYKASLSYVATGVVGTLLRVAKSTLNSAKGFRIAGLSIRAVATVQQTRQVDTYGPELLTAGELLTDYPTRQNVSQSATPITGFSASIDYGDNTLTRYAYKSNWTPTLGLTYLFSSFVQMGDNSIPVPGTQSQVLDDFVVVLGNNVVSNRNNTAVEFVGANIYKTSLRWYANSVGVNQGILKNTTNSAKPFKISGYSVRQVTSVTVPTAPPLSICESGTSTAGLRALVVQANDTSYQVTGTTGDTVAVSAEFQVDGSFGSGAFRGVVLAPLATYSTGTNTTAVDNGSTTFGGLVANFHVLSNTEWVTMKIQHSSDNSIWVDLLTSTSFSQVSSEHLVTPNVVYRYLRVNITASGSTTPRIIVTAARK